MSWYDNDREDKTIYKVVINHEEQYSIWPSDRENPRGWLDVGKSGAKAECLAFIKEVWTDMRPLSLRKKMEEAERQRLATPSPAVATREQPAKQKSEDLITRLSRGGNPVEASLRAEKSAKAFKECIDRGYVHIKFTNTRGGTELGVRLDREATDLSNADFDNDNGVVHLVGGLTLNYVNVKCIADIDLQTLEGRGHLEPAYA
jgi:uncharacterized protein YbdZ (MbtH family)